MSLQTWFRRGSGAPAAALALGMSIWTMTRTAAWQLDADWAMRQMAGVSGLICAVLAAAVALDVRHRFRPSLAELSVASVRGSRGLLGVAGAVWIWAMIANGVCWIALAGVVQMRGGIGIHSGWVFVETATTEAAAAAVGLAVGAFGARYAAVVAAGCISIVTMVVGASAGLTLLQVASSAGTMIGIERTPSRAVLTVLMHAVATVCLTAIALRGWTAWPMAPKAFVVLLLPIIGAVGTAMLVPQADSEYRPAAGKLNCYGTKPRLCGPQSAEPILLTAQTDLHASYAHLRGSGLELPTTLVVARGAAAGTVEANETPVILDPEQIVKGHLSEDAIIGMISVPRQCATLFSDTQAGPDLQRIDRVSAWLRQQLNTTGYVPPAPQQVQRDYRELSQCPLRDR